MSKYITMYTQRTSQRTRMSLHQKSIFNLEIINYCLTEIDHKFTEKNIIVDIGFGNGQQLLFFSENMPDYNFIGIELYKKGIANLINQIKHKNLNNIKIIYEEATIALQKFFYDKSISKIQIFFPDPWPKRRHHKRRLIQKEFINIIKNKLVDSGILHIATDSDDYANYIKKIMLEFKEFDQPENIQPYLVRTTTKFEKIAISSGRTIWELIFVLKF